MRLRMPNDTSTKIAVLGWLPELEHTFNKQSGNTAQHWRRLAREAGVDVNRLDETTSNRKQLINKRMHHLDS